MFKSSAWKALVAAASFAFAVLVATAPAAAAARIVVINGDGPGEGFNDPTPAAPIGGNPGTTKGAQRLIAFNHAARLWGTMLDSNVEIRVLAQFSPLGANVLGSAGATAVFSDFGGVPGFPGSAFAGTWYQSALADKRAGADLLELEGFPGEPDIAANFSSDFDFYLGLDNNHGARIDLVVVVLHELGHGLGFANFVSETTGANFAGQTDMYSQFTLDTTTNTVWSDLTTNAERAASARRGDKISWSGANVTAAVPFVLAFGRPEVDIQSPATIAQSARVGLRVLRPSARRHRHHEPRRARHRPGHRGRIAVHHRRVLAAHQRRRCGREDRAGGSRHLRFHGQGEERPGRWCGGGARGRQRGRRAGGRPRWRGPHNHDPVGPYHARLWATRSRRNSPPAKP